MHHGTRAVPRTHVDRVQALRCSARPKARTRDDSRLGETITRRRVGNPFAEVANPAKQRRLELGNREHHPLVDESPLGRADGTDQSSVRVQIGQLHTNRRGLEHRRAIPELERRDPSQRMPTEMHLRPAIRTPNLSQVIRCADLLQQPQDATRPSPRHVVKPRRRHSQKPIDEDGTRPRPLPARQRSNVTQYEWSPLIDSAARGRRGASNRRRATVSVLAEDRPDGEQALALSRRTTIRIASPSKHQGT